MDEPKPTKDDDWYIRNAIYCWLYYFKQHPWREKYEELAKRESYVQQKQPTTRRKRKPSTVRSKT
ncbi:MAG: hypothetical protein Unbinned8622contig1003_19 [Prokaryotic dsDNA virus sp.]|nr:MAG: hypothetical protein Unbinned8622contig1003_19 [Prokaryotic dsDNA virus sp.]